MLWQYLTSFADVLIPDLWLLLHELLHQLLALFALEDNHLDPSFLEILLASNEILILSDHDTRHLVQDTSPGAHIAWRKTGIHGGALVRGSWKPARIL